mgnify:CR=1 FL=1
MKARKKPVVIECFEFVGGAEEPGWPKGWLEAEHSFSADGTEVYIETLEGRHTGSLGDIIIKGVKGEFYPCKPDIFAATYLEEKDQGLTFGDALVLLKQGKKLRRAGWNGKDIFIELIDEAVGLKRPGFDGEMCDVHVGAFIAIDSTGLQTLNPAAPKTIRPWLASQTDMLAEDWELAE